METWRPVIGYEGLYEVSWAGRLRSLDRLDNRNRKRRGAMKTPTLASNGYYVVVLYRVGRGQYRYLHDLVASAFIGPKPRGFCVNHKNAIRTDNNGDNLEYVTYMDNNQHTMRLGRSAKKLTPDMVRQIRKMRVDGLKLQELGAMFGVNVSSVSAIITGRFWSWLP